MLQNESTGHSTLVLRKLHDLKSTDVVLPSLVVMTRKRDGRFKSRLVGCGNFEDAEGLRTDSPAGDVDTHNIVFSWCAANKVRIKCADISNSYLQGKEVDRIILYRIPKGGIPE